MNEQTLKNLEKQTIYWSKVMIGGVILTWTWLPKKCCEAYNKHFEKGGNGNEKN